MNAPVNVARPGLAIDAPIRELWPDHEAGVIADRLGVQPATVRRRAKALGLPSKSAPSPAPSGEDARKVRPASRPLSGGNLKRKLDAKAQDAPRLEFAPLPPVQPAGPGALILADAPARGACRFPVGEAPEGRMDLQLFCSAPVAKPGCPYCEDHLDLVSPKRKHRK